ncbi:unnamed protein product [Danaus chrysippus]|uniref:(African queen) hypothetical protein n=1 Tax=Danaus chrysippus TaxID=151541 RepID=A0A8J2QUZ1_9NEOP|nr:unnamed protein product [Danaus chrysippus]
MGFLSDAILLVFITAIVDSNEVSDCSTCIKVNVTCFNVSYLFDIQAPFRKTVVITKLGVLRSTNTLYFSFEPNIDDIEYSKIGFISMEEPSNTSVIGAKQAMNFGTFDFDQDNGLVYLGGSDGIYVLDTNTHRVAPYSSRGDSILSMFYRGHVYFIRDREYKIVKKKGDNFDILLDYIPAKNFVINKYNVIVFLSRHGLYAYKNNEFVLLSSNAFFRGLTIDNYGVIYAWWVDGIYKITIGENLSQSRIDKIANTPMIGALTFDSDNNFLITEGKSLYRLTETNTTVC